MRNPGGPTRVSLVWSCSASHVSHVSVPDVLSVHQYVVPVQRPHLALARRHVDLELFAAFFIRLWRSDGVDAVLGKTRHGFPEEKKKLKKKKKKHVLKEV